VAAITTEQSDPESTHKRPGDFFEVAENRDYHLPPASGVRVRRRTLHHGLYDTVNFWNPFREPIPVLLQKRKPRKRAGAQGSAKKFIRSGIQNQPVWLCE